MRPMNSLVQKVKIFLDLSENLIKKGYKKKEIASAIELQAPVFSSLYKTIFPRIVKIDLISSSTEVEREIDSAFNLVNNLSKSRIMSSIDIYINKFKKLSKTSKSETVQFDYIKNLKKHAEFNYNYIKKYYEGIFYFYYVSTDSYSIKRDAFMIKPNFVNKSVECFKGNNNSRVRYYGISTMIGTHILNLHLAEKDLDPNEYILVNISLPSIRDVEFFRGIFTNLTYSRQPIARKVVLTKVSNISDESEFEKLDILYYKDSELSQISEISNYLSTPDAKTECHLVNHPSFSVKDLEKELEFYI